MLKEGLAGGRAGNVRHCVNSAANEQVVDAVADIGSMGVQRHHRIPLRRPVAESKEVLKMNTQLFQNLAAQCLPQIRVNNVSLTAWKVEATMLQVVKA